MWAVIFNTVMTVCAVATVAELVGIAYLVATRKDNQS